MPLIPGCWPGGTVGAAGATTGGVNKLPPVGLMLFSVGAGGVLLVAGLVVVVVVVVDGVGVLLLWHPAVSTPITHSRATPAKANRRALTIRTVMDRSYLSVTGCDRGLRWPDQAFRADCLTDCDARRAVRSVLAVR